MRCRGSPHRRPAGDDATDELDVWSTFTTESPVWRDDDPVTTVMEQVPADPRRDPSGSVDRSGSTDGCPVRSEWRIRPATRPVGSVDITGGYDAAYGARNSSGGGTGEIQAARPYAPRNRPTTCRSRRAASRVASPSAPTRRA